VAENGRNYDNHLAYLSVPVMAQFHLNDRISFLAGGEFNLFLGAYNLAGGYRYTDSPYDRPVTISLGGGIAYQINPRLNIMARYFEGITNAANQKFTGFPGLKFNPRTFQLSLGYFYQRDEDKAYKSDQRTMFSIGFRQGISKYAILKTEYFEDGRKEASSGRNGYQAELDFRFTRRNFYASLGAIYAQKGGHIADEESGGIRQDFLSIPLILGYSPIKTKYLTFSLEGGIALSHLLSSENLPSETPHTSTKSDIATGLYGFELSSDVFRAVTPFISYRKQVDLSFFFERSTEWSDYYYDLRYKGQALSLGLRVKIGSVSGDKDAERPDRAGMDAIVRPFSFGVKAGMNLNDTRHDEPVVGEKDHSDPYLASHFGMYFQIRLHKRLSIVPEVQYIRKGFRFDYDGTRRTTKANYLEFPFILSYQMTGKIAIEAGPVMGLLLNSKFDPGFAAADDYDWYYGGKGIGLEKGIVAGARYKLNDRFWLGGRYYKGVSDVSVQSYSDVDEYNTNIQLFTSFRIK
jgi:hypothetical protein